MGRPGRGNPRPGTSEAGGLMSLVSLLIFRDRPVQELFGSIFDLPLFGLDVLFTDAGLGTTGH